MGTVEQFFSSLGWGLVFLGLLSCVLPKCFKKGVLVMIAGDFFLMLAILFPRMFRNMGFFSMDISYKPIAYFIAVAVWMLIIIPTLRRYIRQRKAVHAAEPNANKPEVAPSSIFNSVKQSQGNTHIQNTLFSGVEKEQH